MYSAEWPRVNPGLPAYSHTHPGSTLVVCLGWVWVNPRHTQTECVYVIVYSHGRVLTGPELRAAVLYVLLLLGLLATPTPTPTNNKRTKCIYEARVNPQTHTPKPKCFVHVNEVFVWGFGVLFLSCVCVSVSGVLFSVCVCVCVCDMLIFLREWSGARFRAAFRYVLLILGLLATLTPTPTEQTNTHPNQGVFT